MKKIIALSVMAACAAASLVSCTCPVCQGSGRQVVVSVYENPNGSHYKETATVKCSGCWGAGWNWTGWLDFAGAAGGIAYGAASAHHAHHHGPALPPPPPRGHR